MNISKMSVAWRLKALSIIVILSSLSIGSVIFLGNQGLEKALLKERTARITSSNIEEVMSVVLDLRRIETAAIAERSFVRFEEFETHTNSARSKLQAIISKDKKASPILTEFVAYQNGVRNLFEQQSKLGLTENDGLQGSLRRSVHNAEEKLSKIENHELMVKMLMMRRHEKDFIMRVQDKYITRLDNRVTEFKSILNAEDLTQSFKTEMTSLIEAYQKDFKNWAHTRLIVSKLSGEVETAFSQLHTSLMSLSQASQITTSENVATSEKHRAESLYQIAALIFFISIFLIIVTNIIGRSIRVPLRSMAKQMLELSDLENAIEDRKGHEIKTMQKTLNIFKKHKEDAEELRQKQIVSNRIARENRIRERTMIVEDLEMNLGQTIQSLGASSDKLLHTSQTLQKDAEKSGIEASQAAIFAKETAAATTAMSQASTELAASIDEIFRQADQSQSRGKEAVENTAKLEETVFNLKNAVEEIVEVVSLIHNIASQTNLLSLNATIEAARAGEAGKGFAVVASEVKQLADQTSKSTISVNERITAIQTAVDSASNAINNVVSHIEQMSGMATQIVSAVETQKSATQDIAERVTEATQKSETVASTLLNLATRVKETHDHSHNLNDSANSLSDQANTLKKDTGEYIERLRIA